MRVLVTGNLGYNGQVVVEKLAGEGCEVLGLDTEYFKDTLIDAAAAPCRQIRADIRDVGRRHLLGVDAVVHLAALSNDALGELDVALTEKINRQASVDIARLSKEAGVQRFVYASSCSVYGIADTSQYATEESPLAPLTAYARAKVAAERDIVSMGDGKFTAVSMRNATMHGVSPRMRLDLVLNNLAASAVADGTVRILSDGTPWRPMLSVDDFAAYVWALLSSPEPRERVYNVGFTAENYQVAALGRMVSDASGAGLEMNAGKTPDERSYKVSFSRAEREFGLKPQKRVAESAAEMVRALAEAGFSRADFESSRFFRIRKIRELVKSGKLDSELRWSV